MGSASSGARTALFVSTQHWHSPFRIGSHHIAREFVRRDWRVGFLAAPVSPLHALGFGEQWRPRFRSWRQGMCCDPRTGVWHYVPFSLLPCAAAPVFRRADVASMAWRGCIPLLRRTLGRAGFLRPDLVYSDHFLHEGALQIATAKASMFRIADRLSAFPGAGADFDARTEALAQQSDIVICTTETLAASFDSRRRTLVIGNGVDLDLLQKATAPPPEYGNDPRPKAVFVGAMDRWVNTGWLAELARRLTTVQVVVIGPASVETRSRLLKAGVTVLGPRSHETLPSYLQHAAVGLAPFAGGENSALVKDIQPLKLYEYLACGLPVVGAGAFQFPNELSAWVTVADDVDGFVDRVRVLTLDTHPRPLPADLRPFSWSARLAPLFAELDTMFGETA